MCPCKCEVTLIADHVRGFLADGWYTQMPPFYVFSCYKFLFPLLCLSFWYMIQIRIIIHSFAVWIIKLSKCNCLAYKATGLQDYENDSTAFVTLLNYLASLYWHLWALLSIYSWPYIVFTLTRFSSFSRSDFSQWGLLLFCSSLFLYVFLFLPPFILFFIYLFCYFPFLFFSLILSLRNRICNSIVCNLYLMTKNKT